MKAVVNLLIVGAQLAISCRGMEYNWNPTHASGDIRSGYYNWSGEENRLVQERTASALPIRECVTAESSGQVASQNNYEIGQNPQNDHVSALRHIRMAEKESPVHQLVFNMDAFEAPADDSETRRNALSRFKVIQNTIQKFGDAHSHPTGQNQATLMVPIEYMKKFFKYFHSNKKHPFAPRTPSDVAVKEMNKFLLPESAKVWRTVYGNRLGIDFIAANEWFTQELRKHYPRDEINLKVVDKLDKFLLAYIFFVDMILTTVRKPPHLIVNRSQSFRAAMASFEQLTEQLLSGGPLIFGNDSSRQASLFTFLAHWMDSDAAYKSSYLFDSHSQLSMHSKAYFNFLFSNSIHNLTTRFARELGLPTSS
ncbi:hypothetical protein PCANC_22846 [Puccinia coronata f. sp. avenae]|uniref:Uncharacterized protein n=1 Tax=Puccinia coronata f. sp. avenae TaxID=200324 RepID=A0A2N5URG4_9BASI|nr:hypothetical protein PCANC_22846 [Puccinia coronata f. sp. avenae]PLW40343.1 hypothetical protein PCASD_07304 [Puccinia coronata f. sp. avenae]